MYEKEAVEIMTRWLSHKNELGKKPAKIKASGTFTYDDNDYVILKFKPDLLVSMRNMMRQQLKINVLQLLNI